LLWDVAGTRGLAEAIISAVLLLYASQEIWFGATLGKRVLGLRIRRIDGELDRWNLLLRWLTKQMPVILYPLFALTGFALFYYIGGLMNALVFIGCLFAANDDKLAWHNQWSHTAVFHVRRIPAELSIPGAPVGQ
jgi:uncharacterized RDD family membrane protein YckC